MASTRDEVYVDIITETKNAVKSMASYAAAVTAAVLVVKKIGDAVGKMEQEFFKSEQAERKLSAAIMATGKQASISVDSFLDLASTLQKVTTYGDDEIVSATAMLQSLANLDEEGLKKVIPGMLDFATAMGVDLETAASLIGKTIGSTTNALTRYGVEVDMSGNKTQKLDALVAGLREKFGGVAEAIGDTAYGASIKLTNAWGDLLEQGGELASMGLTPIRNWMTAIIEKMIDAREKTLLYIQSLKEWAPEAENPLEALQRRIQVVVDLMETYSEIYPSKMVLDKIKALDAERLALAEQIKWMTYEAEWRKKLSAEGAKAAAISERIAEIIMKSAEAQRLLLTPLEEQVITYNLLINELAEYRTELKELKGTETELADLQIIINKLVAARNKLLEEGTAVTTAANSAFEDMGENEEQLSITAETLNILLADRIELYQRLAMIAQDAADAQAEYEKQLEIWAFALGDLALGIGESFGTMFTDVESGLAHLWDVFKNFISDMLIAYAKLWTIEAIAAFAGGNIPEGIGKGAAAVGALVGAGVVRAMGDGGVVTKPTLALIGERGPEAVVPLGRGGAGVTINFYGPVAGEEVFRELAVNAVAEAQGAY